MTKLLIFFVSGATFLTSHTSLTDEWVQFVDPEGQFEVEMPDSAKIDISTAETPIGNLEYVILNADEEIDNKKVKYSLSYCDYPEGVFHPDSTELIGLFFDATVASAVETSAGELIYSTNQLEAGNSAIVWKIATTSGMHIKSKAILVNNRYYCLQVITPESLSIKNNGDRFFSSFKVLRT